MHTATLHPTPLHTASLQTASSHLAALRTRTLDAGWQMRALDPGQQAPAVTDGAGPWWPASVPGTVQQDLLALQQIPDPHVACQEQQVQWVGERDWVYRLRFDAADLPAARHVELLCEGLDTFAEVWLNGQHLASSDNMFVPLRLPVQGLLRPQGNELVLVFAAALPRGRKSEAQGGRRALWNGDSSRLHVRKAGYHYGWDWGPVVMTAGPWRPVRLQAWDLRLADLHPRVVLNDARDSGHIDLTAQVHGLADLPAASREGLRLVARLLDPQGQEVDRASLPCSGSTVQARLQVARPVLWWPRTQGAQALYTLLTELQDAQGTVLDADNRRLGLRTLRLVQAPVAGEPGCSFYFEVNGRALFMGGANWIPDDNLLNRISPQRYRERVQQAVDGNLSMLRVWGGGIYEDDAFYDACDELGVLVWQDFLFACGLYPSNPAFVASVKAEAEAAVRRLRHRASLALWCGNNEDYAVAESQGLYGSGPDTDRFDGRVLYEDLLPQVCAALDPGRPYWPGSPYSPNAQPGQRTVTTDPTVGDRHSWEVWHGAMLPYQDYHKVQGRFVSEFGMQSLPSLPLLQRVIPPQEQFPNSRVMSWHNKAGSGAPDGHRRLAVYLADTLRPDATLAGHVYGTQFVQAEAMRYAYQDFRARWQHEGARAVGGALVWQLNDCWPVTSWAIIDSDGVVKPAWHSIRRAMAPVAVALRLQEGQARAVVMSDRPESVDGTLTLTLFNLDGRFLHRVQQPQQAAANTSARLTLPLPAELSAGATPLVGLLQFTSADGQHQARDVAWPEPFRHHPLLPARIQVDRDAVNGVLWLRAERPAKGVWLQAEGLRFGDNFLDLVPGEALRVPVQGPLDRTLRLWALDQPEQWV